MKTTHALAVIALSIATVSAHAQTANGQATSGSQSGATSGSTASPHQSIEFKSDASGTLKNTPGVILGGFSGSFSSDFCKGVTQGGASAPGFSVALGGQVTDDACVLYRGVERTMQVSSTLRGFNPAMSARMDQAAVDMLCSVPQLAPAMRVQGLCTLPDNTTQRATVQQASIYSGGQ